MNAHARARLPASWRAVTGVTAALALCPVAAARADDDPAPQYFAARFGGHPQRVAVGRDGTIVVAGDRDGEGLPALVEPDSSGNVEGDLFAATLAPDGRPLWSSSIPGAFVYVDRVALGPDGAVWITGSGSVKTISPLVEGNSRGFLARFGHDGVPTLSTYVGSNLEVQGLDIMNDGDAVISVSTSAPALGAQTEAWAPRDVLVSRIARDGSSVYWTRPVFGPDPHPDAYRSAVFVDPDDGSLVVVAYLNGPGNATFAGGVPVERLRPPPDGNTRAFLQAAPTVCVVRLDASGFPQRAVVIPRPYVRLTWAPAVAPGAGGGVLIDLGTRVARLNRRLDWVDSIAIPGADNASIGLVTTNPDRDSFAIGWWARRPGGVRPESSIALRTLGDRRAFRVAGVALAGPHALCVVGSGPGVSFNAPYAASGGASGYVACVPLRGTSAPSDVRLRATGTRTVRVRWPRSGDRAARYEVETVPNDGPPVVVGSAAGGRTSLVARGLLPGEQHELRLVVVFPSGVRSAGPTRRITTPPVAATAIEVADLPGRAVEVTWEDGNGHDTSWVVARRIGDGPWLKVEGTYDFRVEGDDASGWRASFVDTLPNVTAPVQYLVTALAHSRHAGRRRARSETFVPSGGLRVTQTSGRAGPLADGRHEFAVAGTIGSVEGGPPPAFDPTAQDFEVLYADARGPRRFVVASGYPGWTESDGVWRWSAAQGLSPWEDESEIVVDLARGTFVVRFVATDDEFVARDTRWMALNLAWGDVSGGDVSGWRRGRGDLTHPDTRRRGGAR